MEKYRFSEEAFRLMEDSAIPFAVYQFINKRVVTLVVSAGFCRLLGYEDKAQVYWDMDNDMYKDTHPEDRARIAGAAFRFATEDEGYDISYRTRDSESGGYRIVHAIGKHITRPGGARLAYVSYTDEGLYRESGEDNLPIHVAIRWMKR